MRKQSRLMKRRCSMQLFFFFFSNFSPDERSLKLCHDKKRWLANSFYHSVVWKMIWWYEYNDKRWLLLSNWKAAGLIPWLPWLRVNPWAKHWTPHYSWWAGWTSYGSLCCQCMNLHMNGWMWHLDCRLWSAIIFFIKANLKQFNRFVKQQF